MDTTATILHADLDAFYASEASLQGAAPHNGQCDVTAGETAIGKPHPRAAEAAVIGLLDMEARLKRHALERRANCLASDPECARRQRYRALRSRAAELDGADDRAVTIDTAGAARAIETMKREKLAGYEVPCGIGSEAFRAGGAGCEQDQNHHCQPSNHTEASPVTFSDSDLLLVSGRWVALALSHDGLWVFANRILANRIFAHGVLADWRRRHRGRLFARQVGGSGNAQRGEEPSRYDDDDLHDANPLVLGTRTGRPSDAPIPLCLCKTPASTIPRSGSIAGGNGSRLFVALAMEWFKCAWEDREGRRLTKWSHASMVGSDGEVPVHCHSFTRLQPARI